MFPALSEIAILLPLDYINALASGASDKTSLLELVELLPSRLFSYCLLLPFLI